MKIIRLKNVPKESITSALFTGPVVRQSPVTDKDSQYSIDYIHFSKGVRNKFHTHSNDQVLIVTKGKAIVATENEKVELNEGDIVIAPAGEKHWHGATGDSEMTHISITAGHTQLTQLEK